MAGPVQFVPGDALARETDQLVSAEGRTRLLDDNRLHRLAPLLVGHADHRDIGDRGMAEERALHFRRIDVLATRDDHVLDAIINVEITILVAVAGIPGMEPTVADGPRRRLRQGPISEHYLVRAADHFADLAGRQLLSGGVGHLDLGAIEGPAAGADARLGLDAVMLRQL